MSTYEVGDVADVEAACDFEGCDRVGLMSVDSCGVRCERHVDVGTRIRLLTLVTTMWLLSDGIWVMWSAVRWPMIDT